MTLDWWVWIAGAALWITGMALMFTRKGIGALLTSVAMGLFGVSSLLVKIDGAHALIASVAFGLGLGIVVAAAFDERRNRRQAQREQKEKEESNGE